MNKERRYLPMFLRIIGIFLCTIGIIGIYHEYKLKYNDSNYYNTISQSIYEQERSIKQEDNTIKEKDNTIKQKIDSEVDVVDTPNETDDTTPIKEYASSTPVDASNYISINETNICYPLVQSDNNTYYLNHLPNGQESSCGSIFIDYKNTIDDFNMIIYGHNMNNGSMFGNLDKYYKDAEYAKNHSTLIINWQDTRKEYKLFSVQKVLYDSEVYLINPDDKQLWIDTQVSNSIVECNMPANVNDKFITLSTCSKNKDEKIITIWKGVESCEDEY